MGWRVVPAACMARAASPTARPPPSGLRLIPDRAAPVRPAPVAETAPAETATAETATAAAAMVAAAAMAATAAPRVLAALVEVPAAALEVSWVALAAQ